MRVKPRLGSRRGSELVEAMLTMVPLLALIFLIVDTSYGLFVRATLQYAVQAAVNGAAAGGGATGGQLAWIDSTLQSKSLGLTQSPNATVNVNFYAPSDVLDPLPVAAGANAAGNILEVAVVYPFSPLAPLFRSGAAINMTASASAMLQISPPPSL